MVTRAADIGLLPQINQRCSLCSNSRFGAASGPTMSRGSSCLIGDPTRPSVENRDLHDNNVNVIVRF